MQQNVFKLHACTKDFVMKAFLIKQLSRSICAKTQLTADQRAENV